MTYIAFTTTAPFAGSSPPRHAAWVASSAMTAARNRVGGAFSPTSPCDAEGAPDHYRHDPAAPPPPCWYASAAAPNLAPGEVAFPSGCQPPASLRDTEGSVDLCLSVARRSYRRRRQHWNYRADPLVDFKRSISPIGVSSTDFGRWRKSFEPFRRRPRRSAAWAGGASSTADRGRFASLRPSGAASPLPVAAGDLLGAFASSAERRSATFSSHPIAGRHRRLLLAAAGISQVRQHVRSTRKAARLAHISGEIFQM